jgi:hypothetical protein
VIAQTGDEMLSSLPMMVFATVQHRYMSGGYGAGDLQLMRFGLRQSRQARLRVRKPIVPDTPEATRMPTLAAETYAAAS